MAARYDRALSERVVPSLLPGGAYHFLVAEKPVDDLNAVDIQLRERNKLTYYHGTTRVLTVQLRCGSGGVEARAHAAAAYGEHPGSRDAYATLMRWWPTAKADAFRAAFLAYLPAAIAAAKNRDDRTEQAGGWQNRLCVRYGRQWTPADEWLIIDRECVVGFNNAQEQRAYYDGTRAAYQAVKRELQRSAPDVWARPDNASLSDELDLLAIGPSRDLLTIALAHGSDVQGICWGPLRAGLHHRAFDSVIGAIRDSLRTLVRQKVALGLLPTAAGDRVADGSLLRVEPVLAITDLNEGRTCWQKMDLVTDEMTRAGIPRPLLPLKVAKVRERDGEVAVEFRPAPQAQGPA